MTAFAACSNSLFDAQTGDAGGLLDDGAPRPTSDADPLAPDADPLAPDANPFACASLPVAQSGANLGTIEATSSNTLHGSCGNGLPDEDAPEALYKLTVEEASDIRLSVTATSGADFIVYLVADCGAGANELVCADNPDALEYRDAAPGIYYIVVEGYSADDLGDYRLDVQIVDILAASDTCNPASTTSRCATGQLCAGPGATTCQNATTLLDIDFATNLAPAVVTDIGNDGLRWDLCSQTTGCFENETGSASGGNSAIVMADAFQPTDGEVLSTPSIDATGYSKVVLSFSQYFYEWFACDDAGFIEIVPASGPVIRIDTLLEVHKGYTEYDISAQAAGTSFSARFIYDDDTAGTDCNAQSWQLDDIIVRAL